MPRRIGVVVLLAVASCASARTPADTDAAKIAYVGSLSCAAAGCHNGNDLRRAAGSEFGVWSSRDPHARAFAALDGELPRRMMKESRRDKDYCLACHSFPASPEVPAPPADVLADGVSCEACHGPAGAWLHTHYSEEWRGRAAEEAERQGFFPTRDLARRTHMCAGCHIGRPGAEVGHDLIAAGHPRLAFEYTAYHDLLPRHWDRERLPRAGGKKDEGEYGRDFLARAWEIGQVAAARQDEDLIASRKSPTGDFADSDCFACHHDLREPSWRRERPAVGKPGLLPLRSDWYTAAVGILAGGGLDPALKPATKTKGWADALQAAAVEAARQRETVKPEAVRALVLRLTDRDADKDGPANWDHAAQTYLAVAALCQAPDAPHLAPDAIRRLRDTLKFPPTKGDARMDSPRDFDPHEFRDALIAVRAAFGG
jgi:hypothetical protein